MPKLQAVIMAFNAEWSVSGGLSYLADTIRGDEPCELCRITYGGVSKKGEWKRCEKQLLTPVEEVYKNQLTPELAEAIGDNFPMVLARTSQGYVPLLDRAQLEALNQNALALYEALLAALEQAEIQVGPA